MDDYQLRNDIYFDLCRQIHELHLVDCKDVTDYAQKFFAISSDMERLHACTALPLSFKIWRFVDGLGPAYSNIFTNPTLKALLPASASAEATDPFDATFHHTVEAALREERRLAREKELASKVAASSAPMVKEDEAIITVPKCSHCLRLFHSAESCWDLHPTISHPARKGRKANGTERKPGPEGGIQKVVVKKRQSDGLVQQVSQSGDLASRIDLKGITRRRTVLGSSTRGNQGARRVDSYKPVPALV